MTICFRVYGIPTPQGSKTRMPNGAMLEGGSKTQREARRDWRSAVATAAAGAANALELTAPLDGALSLHLEFRFPMPANRPRRIRDEGSAPKVSAPDLDKLIRAVGDGLTAGGLIRDDARIVYITAAKREVVGWTGVDITVRVGEFA